jgi:hypothetical protein
MAKREQNGRRGSRSSVIDELAGDRYMDPLDSSASIAYGCGEQRLEVGDHTMVVRSLQAGRHGCDVTVRAFPRASAATPPFHPAMEARPSGSLMVFPRRAGQPAPLSEAALEISPGWPLVLSLCHVQRRGPDVAVPTSDGLGSDAGRRLGEEA